MRKGILLSILLLILSCGVATARTASATGPPSGIWGDVKVLDNLVGIIAPSLTFDEVGAVVNLFPADNNLDMMEARLVVFFLSPTYAYGIEVVPSGILDLAYNDVVIVMSATNSVVAATYDKKEFNPVLRDRRFDGMGGTNAYQLWVQSADTSLMIVNSNELHHNTCDNHETGEEVNEEVPFAVFADRTVIFSSKVGPDTPDTKTTADVA